MKKMRQLASLLLCAVLTVSGCGSFLPQKAERPKNAEALEEKEPKAAAEQPVFTDSEKGISYAYCTKGKYLAIYNGEEFEPTYLNGVNIGAGVPGYFPGELGIKKEAYARWFQQISDMNCNCIRVYTTLRPQFYEALSDFNRTSDKKLYLIMGVWYDEDQIIKTGDAYDVLDYAVDEAKEQIDIIHGDCMIQERAGRASGNYKADISKYVLGWILGIESDAEFVGTTNEKHRDIKSYDGTYFSVENADAFHAFLAQLADETVAYETEKYGMQRPVSWANWPTADELTHPDEPLFEVEDAVTINVERIRPKETFLPGTFASYHIYPYYPDFMVVEEQYKTHRDKTGRINTYEAYLQDLRRIHKIPVLVAEFGVPTSRGCTHVNPYSHYDQGHMTEEEQGEAVSSMARDIYENGYCGGIVFTWQDEWFKRTWNTMEYTEPERRAYWSDIQTSEQYFGLLSFDPGEEKMCVLTDGDFSDWEDAELISEYNGYQLFTKHDERYLYLCIKGESLKPETDRIVLPIDTTQLSGSSVYDSYAFDRPADFVIDLNGREKSTVLVHRYYDRYAFAFGNYDKEFDATGFDNKDSKLFVPIYLCMNRTQWIPTTGEKRDAERLDTGKLRYGIGDPDSKEYDSLSDFCYGPDFIEMRLPWELLSFRDPSTKEIEGDFWANDELTGIRVSEIYIGANTEEAHLPMTAFTWEDWDQPVYHERLKKSYDMVKSQFGKLKLKASMLEEETDGTEGTEDERGTEFAEEND